MSKVLVVAYSYTGTSRRLAQSLALMQKWTLAEVREVDPRHGFRGLWRCVLDSLLRRRPAIGYDGPDPAGFVAVVLVSPIWASRLAGPMRSFVAAHAAALPDIAVASVTGGGGGAPKAVAEIAQLVGRPPMMDASFNARDVMDGSCAGQLENFARDIVEAEESVLDARPPTWSRRAA